MFYKKEYIKDCPDKWTNICSRCNKIIKYKTVGSFYAHRNKKTICMDCKHKQQSIKLTGHKREPFSIKWRKNIAIGHKRSKKWKQSMNNEEYKEKQRKKMLRLIKENKSVVCYNKEACGLFDYINKSLNWNGNHGTNGKEKIIDNFYLDYYEPTLNLAIEYDESYHNKPKQKKLDFFRQNIILNKLNCEFYRINDKTKKVIKMDKLYNNNTDKLQMIVDNYFIKK